MMPEEKGAGTATWAGKVEIPHLGKDTSPHPHTPFAPRALGGDSLRLGSVWPQPDTQHCEPLGKSCSSAGKHTAPTVSGERHGPGPHSGSASVPQPGEDQAWQIPWAPFSNSPASWSPPASLPVRCAGCALYHSGGLHSHRGQCVNCNVYMHSTL